VTNEKSFHNIKMWVENIDKYAADKVCKIIVANKCDCDSKDRIIDLARGEAFAEKYNIKHIETSAKSGLNIGKVFHMLAKDAKRCSEPGDDHGSHSLQKSESPLCLSSPLQDKSIEKTNACCNG